jgi:hypothetical protein
MPCEGKLFLVPVLYWFSYPWRFYEYFYFGQNILAENKKRGFSGRSQTLSSCCINVRFHKSAPLVGLFCLIAKNKLFNTDFFKLWFFFECNLRISDRLYDFDSQVTDNISHRGLCVYIYIYLCSLEDSFMYIISGGRGRWGSWLRHCATNRQVGGSITDGVTGIFSLT